MRQNELSPAAGSRRGPKRVGRGDASGHGSYSGRGLKGQKARAGCKMKPGFEGGQLPIIKRLPEKRGFTNIFAIECSVVNIDSLSRFEAGTEVTPVELAEAGLVKSLGHPIKVLGRGELKQALTVKANHFSASAKAKIEAAGGKAEEI